jgi:hypothetical protein
MRDDMVGLFEFHDRFRRGEIEVIEGLIFEPADPCSRPFAWVSSMFDYRAELLKVDRNDVRAIVIKLMLSSIYGKLAQGIGGSEEPPLFASPWMAAAVTAGTRLQLLQRVRYDAREQQCPGGLQRELSRPDPRTSGAFSRSA